MFQVSTGLEESASRVFQEKVEGMTRDEYGEATKNTHDRVTLMAIFGGWKRAGINRMTRIALERLCWIALSRVHLDILFGGSMQRLKVFIFTDY